MPQPRRLIRDLEPGQTIDQPLLLRDREIRRTSNGSIYMACLLGDHTGTLAGRWWKVTEADIEALPTRAVVQVTARVQRHKGQRQLILERLEVVPPDSAAFDELLPTTEGDVEAMWASLRDVMDGVRNLHLRRLVEAFFEDEALVEQFKRSPAGTSLHHALVGGLLEHTLSVVRLAQAAINVYGDKISGDLLLVGALLHDVGKTEELSVAGGFGYTDRGNLVGHITQAVLWVQERAALVAERSGEPFPPVLIDLVQHLIISHHGQRDRGSPKPPMIPEAILLHALDDLDTRVDMATAAIAEDRDGVTSFTRFHRVLDVKLFKRPRPLPGDPDSE